MYFAAQSLLPSTSSLSGPTTTGIIGGADQAVATTDTLSVAADAMAIAAGQDSPTTQSDIAAALAETTPGSGQVSLVGSLGFDPADPHLVKFGVALPDGVSVDVCVTFPATAGGSPTQTPC
jgi:hypothetical protein